MTAAPATETSARTGWLAAALVTLAIGALHVFFLFHAGGLWRDEVNVVNLAGSHSLVFMARDSFPILMPLLVKIWLAAGLGDSDLNLRMFGALTGLGLAGALWLAAWTARRAPPLLGLILLGLNGTVIFWGDSLRAFGLGSLLIVLACAAMGFLLEKPTWRRAGILSVAAVLSVQALYQNAVLFASIGLGGWLVCWLRKDKGAALKILAAGMVAFVSLLPYWGCVKNWSQSAAVIRPGFSFTAAAGNFKTVTAFPLPEYVWLWVLLGATVVGLGVANFFQRPPANFKSEISNLNSLSPGRLAQNELRVFAGAILISSLAGYWIFLHVAALITEPWYFLPLVALEAVCFDLGIFVTSLPRGFRAVVFTFFMATAGIAILFAARDLNCRFTNVDAVARDLMKKISPQDYVVVTPWYLGISFDRYYHGAAAWDTLPPVADHSTHRFDLAQTAENRRASQPVLDRIGSTLQAGHQVWIVGWMRVPPPGRPATTEAGRFLAEHSASFETLNLPAHGAVSDYEEVSVLLASGWKTNAP
jgi:hypothetical protein